MSHGRTTEISLVVAGTVILTILIIHVWKVNLSVDVGKVTGIIVILVFPLVLYIYVDV